MGSRRLGWAGGGGGGCGGCPLPEPTRPMPIPVASIDLTLEELLNLLVDVFSFFLFCYIEKKEKEVHGGVKKGADLRLGQNDEKKWE